LTVLGWHLACPFDSFKVGWTLRRLSGTAPGKSGCFRGGHLQFSGQRRDFQGIGLELISMLPVASASCHFPQGNKLDSNLGWSLASRGLHIKLKTGQDPKVFPANWLSSCLPSGSLSIYLSISTVNISTVSSVSDVALMNMLICRRDASGVTSVFGYIVH